MYEKSLAELNGAIALVKEILNTSKTVQDNNGAVSDLAEQSQSALTLLQSLATTLSGENEKAQDLRHEASESNALKERCVELADSLWSARTDALAQKERFKEARKQIDYFIEKNTELNKLLNEAYSNSNNDGPRKPSLSDATHFIVDAGVRYWDDADINGKPDEDGSIFGRDGNR